MSSPRLSVASDPSPVGGLYPPRPEGAPADLTRPSPAYQRRAWAAVAGLVGFAVLYLGLIAWLGRSSWRVIAGNGEPAYRMLLAGLLLFLVAFLVKGLFFVRRAERTDAVLLSPSDEPELFAFIHRIADEAGAPRPNKVFVTPEVNASVGYDVSFWNLLFPSRKNLYIGLGLVNVLTLDELKAVLAHEFGHFAQRTMAVGSWVYVAGQAVGAIVERRDGFDRFLQGISHVDLRIAWIGWVMRLVVFAIRAVLETMFRGVVVLQRGLSREMELQADLVSVSLCGSDSLVHALHRLSAADDALDRASAFAAGEARAERRVADLYTVHTRCLAGLRRLRNDPGLGEIPARPESDPAAHRVFEAGLAEAPRMWASHPPSREREENAKRRYVASPLDARPAWVLFRDAAATRRSMTERLFRDEGPQRDAPAEETLSRLLQDDAPAEAAPGREPSAAAPIEETLARLDALFAQRASEERYRGVYVGRSPVRWAASRAELYGPVPADPAAITAALDALYPVELVGELKALRIAHQHLDELEALRRGQVQAAGGVLRFEGRVVRRAELPALIGEVKEQRDRLTRRLQDHDRAVRTAHRAAARALGGGWEAHLDALAALLHCATHCDAEVEDANGFLGVEFTIVTADGNVSDRELSRLLRAAQGLRDSVAAAAAAGAACRPPLPASEGADLSWQELLAQPFTLGDPTREALGANWLGAAHSWVVGTRIGLGRAARFALDALLHAEDHVARCHREGLEPGPAPAPARVPPLYPVLLPGAERARQERLDGWDRFLLADGWGPGALRLGAAGAILAPGFLLTAGMMESPVVVYNGLNVPVRVHVGEHEDVVPAGGEVRFLVPPGDLAVSSATLDGTVIEAFAPERGAAASTAVYNVARAGLLVEERVGYGRDGEPGKILGNPPWLETSVSYVFTEPPERVNADGPVVRGHVYAVSGLGPLRILSGCPDPECEATLSAAHALHDDPTRPEWADWVSAIPAAPDVIGELVAERAAADPDSVALGRMEIALEVPGACARRTARANEQPDNPDAVYLALQCHDREGRDTASLYALAMARFPDHPWLTWHMAWADASAGESEAALARLVKVRASLPLLATEASHLQVLLLRGRGASVDAQTAVLPDDDRGRWNARLLRAEATGDPGDVSDLMPVDHAVLLMAAGRIEQASAVLEGVTVADAGVRWLLAGSDGATPELRARALEQGAEGVGVTTLATATALARLASTDPAPLLAAVQDPAGVVVPSLAAAGVADDATLLALVEEACRAPLSSPCPELGVYTLVRLGERAPAALRAQVKAGVLPDERGFFR